MRTYYDEDEVAHKVSIIRRHRSGVSFIPTNISGCILWLRSDLGITMDGSNRVSKWADQSGIGNDFSQSIDANKFVWTDSELNGYPGLIADGSSDEMHCVGFTYMQPIDFYMVVKQISWTSTDRIMGDTAAHGYAFNIAQLLVGSPDIAIYSGTDWVCVNSDLTVGSYKLLQATFNGASSLTRVNGGSPVTGNPGVVGSTDLWLASIDGANHGNISFVEIVAYNSAIGDSDRINLQNYFNGKYIIY